MIPGKYYFLAVLILAVAFMASGAWWSYNRHKPKPPRPIPDKQYAVVGVPTGASIQIPAGLLGKRTATVNLLGISAPAVGEKWFEESRQNLTRIAGESVLIKAVVTAMGDNEFDDYKCSLSGDMDGPFNGPPVAGNVYGISNQWLNLEQVKTGWADCAGDADKEILAAKKAAYKAKIGIWSK